MHRSEPSRLEFTIPCDPARLRRLRERVRDYLLCLSLRDEMVDDVVLALMEALTNALRQRCADHAVAVRIEVAGDDLVVRVQAAGECFDPDPYLTGVPPGEDEMHGRGLFIMGCVMDRIAFDFSGCVCVTMTRRLEIVDGRARSRDLLLAAAADSAEATIAVDWEWECLSVSAAAAALLGTSVDSLARHSLFAAVPALDAAIADQCRRAMEFGDAARVTLYYESSGRWLEIAVVPWLFGVLLSLRDVDAAVRTAEEHRLLRDQRIRLEHEAERLRVLELIGNEIRSVTAAPEAYLEACDRAADLLGLQTRGIWLYEAGRWWLFGGEARENDVANDSPARLEMLRATQAARAACRLGEDTSTMVVTTALVAETAFVGHVVFTAPAEHEVSSADLEYLARLGAILGGALQNALLCQEQNAQLELTRALLQSSKVLTEWTDLMPMLDRLAAVLQLTVPRARAAVLLLDMERQEIRVAASHGSERLRRVVEHFDDLPAAVADMLPAPATLLLDYAKRPSDRMMFPGDRLLARYGLVVPLVTRQRLVGLLLLEAPASRHTFTALEVSAIEAIADQTATAIENARLFDAEVEAQRRASRELEIAQLLVKVGSAFAAEKNPEELLDMVVRTVTRSFDDARVTISMVGRRADEFVVAAAAGPHGYKVGTIFMLADCSLPAQKALAAGRAITVDYDNLSAAELGQQAGSGSHFSIVAPLVLRGRALGLLTIDHAYARYRFSDRDVSLAQAIAEQAAIAIDNARSFASEHRIAETLQEAMLAMPAAVPGYHFAHTYHSATLAARVGGDFYDVFQLNDGRIGTLMGDVSGKGVDAAVLTSVIKNAIKTLVAAGERSPAGILRVVNDVVFDGTAPEMFASVFFALHDHEAGVLTYSNAGHASGMVVASAADEDVRPLTPTGPIVGAIANVEFADDACFLAQGDLLFLYTDGLIEAKRGDDLFGEPRLIDVLTTLRGQPPKDVIATIEHTAVDFVGGVLGDDLALLAITPA